jgi:predicted NAD/FAD-binding protein
MHRKSSGQKNKIAVIGAGISGLSAAYLFQQRHEVHLFESEGRLGGHANTVFVGPTKAPVDTGFIVFNDLNYPNLSGLFRHLEVDIADSEMSLSVRFQKPDLEWGGTSLRTLVAQKRNLFRPKFILMVQDILRFHREALANIDKARINLWSLRDLLTEQRYSESFIEWYLLPMGAAIWSTPPKTMLEFPAETFLQFCMNHRLLQVNDRPTWKTVRGGSICYVNKIASYLKNIHSGGPVQRVHRTKDGVELFWNGQKHEFDAVIFATHPPETLKILSDRSVDEHRVLSNFVFQKNLAQLHSDESFMPKRRSLWSSWNFHQQDGRINQSPISLSYWMNRLQPLTTDRTMIVSLNSTKPPLHLHREIIYEHPLFNSAAIQAQGRLEEIQGQGGVFHCGAWTRYGFHEDGILSSVRLAQAWHLPIPWLEKSYGVMSNTLSAQGA